MSENWEAQRKLWQDALKNAVNFYLNDADEMERVVAQTWEQAERVYTAADQEASITEILSRVAAEQCERLLPRLPGSPERTVPTDAQIFRLLEMAQFEQIMHGIRQRVDLVKGDARERQIDVTEEIANLERLQQKMIADFYNKHLPLDDDDEAGGAIGVFAKVGPPMRGPGGGRTFEEALEAPRNP